MCTFVLPLILNLLLILYCITNLKTKYNIVYIVWFIFSIVPIMNWAAITAVPVFITFNMDDFYKKSIFEFKPTKLNKFLFGYEERKN